jgi:hypothetical protein
MSDDYRDNDRSELGHGLLPATQQELDEMALARSRATGRIVATATFTGSDTMSVHDVRDDGELELVAHVPLEHPSPSLALDLEPDEGG